jgi:hypothetical protein
MTPDMTLELTLELARVSREPGAADRRRVLEAVRRSMRKPLGWLGSRADAGSNKRLPGLAPTCR